VRRIFLLPAILLVPAILCFSNGVCAQSSPSGNSTQPPAAQSRAPQTAESQDAAKKKKNKVWTNEDVGALTGSVSVVGDPAARDTNKAEPTQKSSEDARDAAWYQQRLAPLRAQLDSVDRQIQKLKNFKGSNAAPDGGIQYGGRYNMTPLAEQVKQLEAKKRSLQSNIDDLESDARHHGIEPGGLH
jgi:hypothetical protein